MAEEREIAWLALKEGTRVEAADGADLGQITSIVGDDQQDIFSGIAFRSGVIGPSRFAPAETIGEITSDRVSLTLSADEAASLDEFSG